MYKFCIYSSGPVAFAMNVGDLPIADWFEGSTRPGSHELLTDVLQNGTPGLSISACRGDDAPNGKDPSSDAAGTSTKIKFVSQNSVHTRNASRRDITRGNPLSNLRITLLKF